MKLFFVTICIFLMALSPCQASEVNETIRKHVDVAVFRMKKMKRRAIYFLNKSIESLKRKVIGIKNELISFKNRNLDNASFKFMKLKRFVKWKSKRAYLSMRFQLYRIPKFFKGFFNSERKSYVSR